MASGNPGAGLVSGAAELVTVVVPCCNEAEVLPRTCAAIDALSRAGADRYRFHFVLVDDGSTDATWPILNELFGNRADCTLLRHGANRGITAACLTGFRAAESEIVASFDCDLSYDPQHLLRLLESMTPGVDCVTGSPYHPQGGVRNVPEWRVSLSRTASFLYRMVLRQRLATYTSCFRVYRRDAVLDLNHCRAGFLGMAEILARMDAGGRRIVEVPVILNRRVAGRSKLRVVPTVFAHLQFVTALACDRIANSWRQ